ncbi:hypothetical protein F6X38_09775 [Aureimonas leprariae]|uniref:Uncharacterized protein n=1 Tax=Plantimonas leprariae TaxID=2615207 RepID=A0A7V7PPS9_9HYPH|nr:hypothetical protein F6X38_09775 [Aureimonas leprariae]
MVGGEIITNGRPDAEPHLYHDRRLGFVPQGCDCRSLRALLSPPVRSHPAAGLDQRQSRGRPPASRRFGHRSAGHACRTDRLRHGDGRAEIPAGAHELRARRRRCPHPLCRLRLRGEPLWPSPRPLSRPSRRSPIPASCWSAPCRRTPPCSSTMPSWTCCASRPCRASR